jgi:hypothetical protein
MSLPAYHTSRRPRLAKKNYMIGCIETPQLGC